MTHGGARANANDFSKTTVGTVLFQLYEMHSSPLRQLQNHCALSTMNYSSLMERKNMGKYQAAMTLAEALMTTKQRKVAITGKLPSNDAKREFLELDNWVKKAAAALDGAGRVSGQRRAYWMGVGNVVKKSKVFNDSDSTPFIAGFIPKIKWEDLQKYRDDQDMLADGKSEPFRKWVERRLSENKKAAEASAAAARMASTYRTV